MSTAIINANFDRRAHSLRSGIDASQGDRTRQDQKEDADINRIVRDFGVTRTLPNGIRVPSYGDFDTINDYRTAIHAVREAEDAFEQLPAKLRAKLNNDPQAFLEYAANPANHPEMTELGLINRPAEHVKVGNVGKDGELIPG